MTDEELLIENLQHFIQHAMTDSCKCKNNDQSFYSLEHAMINIDSYYRSKQKGEQTLDLTTL